jgi:hypothetical protein
MDDTSVHQAPKRERHFQQGLSAKAHTCCYDFRPGGAALELISRIVFVGVFVLAGVLLFTPYEPFLEGVIALVIIAAAVAGFSMHPRREVFYVRTSVRLMDADKNKALEQDFLAVKVELARLWLLFVPTFLAVAFLVFFAAGGPMKFSFFNWIFSSPYAYAPIVFLQYPPLLVLVLLSVWIGERRVMRDAEARSARSFCFSNSAGGRIARVSYLFMGDHGEYYGGDCLHFGLVHPSEIATIVFHNVRTPEPNKIAMGFLFHRLIILGRGVTDLDKHTIAAQTALAETTSLS